MRGRKPKPTHLKLLEGNPDKRAINGAEPQPARGIPTCPAHLSPPAKAEWKRLAQDLHRIGLLTLVDRGALAAYCQSWGRWVEAERKLQETPPLLKTPAGYVHCCASALTRSPSARPQRGCSCDTGAGVMGRTAIILSEAQKAEVETLAAVLTAEQVADYFGIGRRTFYSMMQRDEEIAARYKRGKAKAIGVIAQGLINKARSGDTTSMIFFLKTQGGWRETREMEPAPSADGNVLDLSAFTDDTLQELLDVVERSIAAKTQAMLEIDAVPEDACEGRE